MLLTRTNAQRIFRSKEDKLRAGGDENLHIATKVRINLFIASIVTVIIVALFMAPIFALFHITTNPDLSMTQSFYASAGVLIVSTLIMIIMLSMFTQAKRYENLAASAA